MKKMMFKKLITMGGLLSVTLLFAGCGSAENKAPESITFTKEAYMLAEVGDTFDAASVLEIVGDNVNQEVIFSSSDEEVVTVTEDGVVTAAGDGIATIVATSTVDEEVSASMDVAVYDYYGTYSGEKYIDAMSCEIAISITLQKDGTFNYYRAPMNVAMSGGGEMPEMTDEGSYEINGTEIAFKGEVLGEYTSSFDIIDGTSSIEGQFPTGGPQTDMVLIKDITEE